MAGSSEPNGWAGVLGPIVGGFLAILGGIITSYLTQLLTAKREREGRKQVEIERRVYEQSRYQEKTMHELQDIYKKYILVSHDIMTLRHTIRLMDEDKIDSSNRKDISTKIASFMREATVLSMEVRTLFARVHDPEVLELSTNLTKQLIYVRDSHINPTNFESTTNDTIGKFSDLVDRIRLVIRESNQKLTP